MINVFYHIYFIYLDYDVIFIKILNDLVLRVKKC